MTDIVERLRAEAFDAVNWDGETMKQWDKIRKQAETLPGSDLPRLMFQGLIESLAELMVESACEIERLRNVAQSAWRGPLESVSWWLEGCLNCKTWHWDGLQREAAEQALNEAHTALAMSSAERA
jgi:hypothetical protein